MTTQTQTRCSKLGLLAVSLLFIATNINAAQVTVNFSANVVSAQNSFAGAGPTVSGSFTYDTIQGTDFNGDPSAGLYQFSGSPYGFTVTVDAFGALSGSSSLVQVGDDGVFLPGFDTVQFAGNDGTFQASLDWSGATSTFTGDDLPAVSVIEGMNPFFVIREFGQIDLQAIVTSADFVTQPVPVPAAVWLFGSALGLLGWIRRRNS